jgi:hypothetical protein
MVEIGRGTIIKKMQKNLVAYRRDEERYQNIYLLSKKPFQILCTKV